MVFPPVSKKLYKKGKLFFKHIVIVSQLVTAPFLQSHCDCKLARNSSVHLRRIHPNTLKEQICTVESCKLQKVVLVFITLSQSTFFFQVLDGLYQVRQMKIKDKQTIFLVINFNKGDVDFSFYFY